LVSGARDHDSPAHFALNSQLPRHFFDWHSRARRTGVGAFVLQGIDL